MSMLSEANPVLLMLAAVLLLGAAALPRLGLAAPPWVRGLLGVAGLLVLAVALYQRPPPPAVDCMAVLAPKQASARPTLFDLAPGGVAQAAPRRIAFAPAAPAMGLLSGPRGLTYFEIVQALAEAMQSPGDGLAPVDLMPLESGGTLDNIRRINSPENAGAGLVQSDVLQYLPNSNDPRLKALVGKLRLVLPMHTEEVHVLVRRDRGLDGIASLRNKRVLVPKTSEGSRVSAENLLRLSQLQDVQLDATLDPAQAICAVVNGQADAVLVTTGQPTPLLARLGALSPAQKQSITFMPLHDGKSPPPEGYSPAELRQYDWHPAPVHTLAVRSLLVAYDFSSKLNPHFTKRCDDLRRMGAAIGPALKLLRQGNHPKWAAMDPNAPVAGWQDDRCAWPNGRPRLP